MSWWLSRMQERRPLIRKSVAVQFQRGRKWIIPRWRWIAGSILVGDLLIGLLFRGSTVWAWYQGSRTPSEAISPLLTLATGAAVAWVALIRHFATTDADRKRRITESFSKAIEQLGNDKLEIRLGGIYMLERISQ